MSLRPYAGFAGAIATCANAGLSHHVRTAYWGGDKDYLYGKFDGIKSRGRSANRPERQQIGHGGRRYICCPGHQLRQIPAWASSARLDARRRAINSRNRNSAAARLLGGLKARMARYYGEDLEAPNVRGRLVSAPPSSIFLSTAPARFVRGLPITCAGDYTKRTGRQVVVRTRRNSRRTTRNGHVSPESRLAR